MRRFFISGDKIANNVPDIIGDDARHIAQVLRMQPGDSVELFDGSGWVYEARLEAVHPQRVQVTVRHRFPSPCESALNLVKDDEPDVMILDLKMPGLDGLEATRRIKNAPPFDPNRPGDIHNTLARLPFPVYITTNYTNAMTQALAAQGPGGGLKGHFRGIHGMGSPVVDDDPDIHHGKFQPGAFCQAISEI